MFNCSITCNMTGVEPRRSPIEHLAKIQDCNLVFQVWSNNTIVDQVNCTKPKGMYSYRHEAYRYGRIMRHVYPLKKGRYSFRYKISVESLFWLLFHIHFFTLRLCMFYCTLQSLHVFVWNRLHDFLYLVSVACFHAFGICCMFSCT